MDTAEKLALLGSAARYEIAGERQQSRIGHGPRAALCVGDTAQDAPGTLLRVLQSSYCEHDCAYCPLRRSNDPMRTAIGSDELAQAFADQWLRRRVDGLMLSSATDGNPDAAMQRMIDTVRILRVRHQFDGYVHLKILPGSSDPSIAEAASVADRLSLNVEVPAPEYLDGLETGKRWQRDILRPLHALRRLSGEGQIRTGATGQLLVGVAANGRMPAADRALADASRRLRREFNLRRVHYGSFQPAAGTPLADALPPDPRRRARLYQWDWLATQYQFADAELDAAFDTGGNLPLALDPKLAVSLAVPDRTPVEVNTADYDELLRVPGIGPVSARRIVDMRYLGTLADMADLKVLGVVTSRAAPFVLLNGRRPPEATMALRRIRRALREVGPQPVQLTLFPELAV
jgi:predicted DNA-binding helix-hairpin-helix protein